jgi:OmcA/MtrC family decaheme c-type cytochrome
VKAGTPYQIIGFAQTTHDYSKVGFSANIRNCQACHDQTSPAVQKDAWLTPSRRGCGSCHDNIDFATGKNHANLAQVNDTQCINCHTTKEGTEFDLTIRGAHTIATQSMELPGTILEILEVKDGAPGTKPVVTFSVKDKAGNPILANEMTRLVLVLSGPTTDFGGDVTEDVRTATGSNGVYTWTFAAAVPATAKGSYAVGIEGYRNITIQKGAKHQQVVRDAGVNKVMTFAVTDPQPVPRRTVVTLAKCNACHGSLSLHGNNRNAIEQCVLCHHPTSTDAARRPAAQGPPESVDFRSMIHKIHTGAELSGPYSIYGFGGNAIGFNDVGFPGKRNHCSVCHVNNSEQLPLAETAKPVLNPRGTPTTLGPETAACTSCHTSKAALAHALVNTSAIGESCAACHGPGSAFAVSKVHAQ